MEYPTLAGNLAAIVVGLVVSVSISLAKPVPFDWEITRSINAKAAPPTPSPPASTPSSLSEKGGKKAGALDQKNREAAKLPTVRNEDAEQARDQAVEDDPASLRRAFKVAYGFSHNDTDVSEPLHLFAEILHSLGCYHLYLGLLLDGCRVFQELGTGGVCG